MSQKKATMIEFSKKNWNSLVKCVITGEMGKHDMQELSRLEAVCARGGCATCLVFSAGGTENHEAPF